LIRYLDHDADLGFEVQSGDLAELWDRAARALTGVLTDPDCVRPKIRRTLEVEAPDPAALLVESLSELLLLFEVEGFLCRAVERFDLAGDDGPLRVRLVLCGELYDQERHPAGSGIKAVTYHGAVVEQRDGRWFGRVLLDL